MQKTLIIIPTYNEFDNIFPILKTLFNLLPEVHILVVDDASPDRTADIVQHTQDLYPEQLHLLRRPQKDGLGKAYLAGFQFALEKDYAYILTMDSDFSHPPEKVHELYQSCHEKGYDLAIGSRYINGFNVVNWPMRRIILSYMANWMVRLITGLPVKDATAGFHCYKRKILETLELEKITSVGYSFQVEMKFLAWKHGFQLQEVPIMFTNRVMGVSKMSHHIILEGFFKIIHLKAKSWFKKYKKHNLQPL